MNIGKGLLTYFVIQYVVHNICNLNLCYLIGFYKLLCIPILYKIYIIEDEKLYFLFISTYSRFIIIFNTLK